MLGDKYARAVNSEATPFWQQSATTARKTIGGEEVEDFGLGDGALRVHSHHLRGSG